MLDVGGYMKALEVPARSPPRAPGFLEKGACSVALLVGLPLPPPPVPPPSMPLCWPPALPACPLPPSWLCLWGPCSLPTLGTCSLTVLTGPVPTPRPPTLKTRPRRGSQRPLTNA